jgi:hypothetical protein
MMDIQDFNPRKHLPPNILIQPLIHCAGNLNMAIESAISESMRKLVLPSIRMGQENPNVPPASLFPVTSRRVFTEQFIAEGRALYDQHLQRYRANQYIALAIDAGKLGHANYLDILITNAYIDAPPLIHKAVSHFAGTTEAYVHEICGSISELERDGFAITGIVSDNLRVQVSAIEAVQEEKNHTFIHVPCGCHCLALAILDLCTQNDALAQAVAHIEAFSQLMTTRAILSKLKCSFPTRCMTRWTNLFDISAWIIEHMTDYPSSLKIQPHILSNPSNRPKP